MTAGDAVGATPPISSVFGDLPTIEAMNALGFGADSLGNHNFDAGSRQHVREPGAGGQLPIPLGQPRAGSRRRDARRRRPAIPAIAACSMSRE